MKRLWVILFLAIFGLALNVLAEEAVLEEEADYDVAYGKVTALDIGTGTITVQEEESQKVVAYSVKEDVELEGVGDFGEIKVGDWVDLEYLTDEEGKNIVSFIAVETKPASETEAIEETEEVGVEEEPVE